MKQSVQITILGQQYTIKSDLAPDRVTSVAQLVNEKIAEVSSSDRAVDSMKTAVLALLNIAGEYMDLRDEEPLSGEVRQRMERLVSKLEAASPE